MKHLSVVRHSRVLVWIVLTLMLLVSAPAASAHRPVWEEGEGATRIPDLSTSYAFYEELASGSQVDVYRFEGEAGQQFYAGINIPAINGLEDYGVRVALVGPGLTAAGDNPLPVELPADAGAQIFPSEVTEDFFEPFTQTNYWGRQQIDMTLPASGDYFLLIWNPAGETGKYVLDTGRAEVFGPADLFRFPLWWVRVHAYFGHTPYMIGAALLLITVITGFVWWRRREEEDASSAGRQPLPDAAQAR